MTFVYSIRGYARLFTGEKHSDIFRTGAKKLRDMKRLRWNTIFTIKCSFRVREASPFCLYQRTEYGISWAVSSRPWQSRSAPPFFPPAAPFGFRWSRRCGTNSCALGDGFESRDSLRAGDGDKRPIAEHRHGPAHQ